MRRRRARCFADAALSAGESNRIRPVDELNELMLPFFLSGGEELLVLPMMPQ